MIPLASLPNDPFDEKIRAQTLLESFQKILVNGGGAVANEITKRVYDPRDMVATAHLGTWVAGLEVLKKIQAYLLRAEQEIERAEAN